MPNDITTILNIEDAGGVPLDAIREKFVNAKGQVDFDVVLPRPECLRDFEPHSGIISRAQAALGLLPDPNKLNGDDIKSLTGRLELSNALRDVTTPARPEDIPLIARAIQNYAECGYTYWYDWCSAVWGTKWNCYGQPEGGHPEDATTFEFQTAWRHPEDLIRLISERLPGVTLSVRYADEDTGSNCGQYRIRSGEPFDTDIAPRWDDQTDADKRRWTEFAFRINHGEDADPAAYGYDENWVYSDDVYEAYEQRKSAALN